MIFRGKKKLILQAVALQTEKCVLHCIDKMSSDNEK